MSRDEVSCDEVSSDEESGRPLLDICDYLLSSFKLNKQLDKSSASDVFIKLTSGVCRFSVLFYDARNSQMHCVIS